MWVLNTIWHVSLHRGEIWTQTDAHRGQYEDKGRDWSDSQQTIRNQEREKHETGFSLAVLRRYKPCRYLDIGLLVSRTMRQQIFIFLNHPICGTLLLRVSKLVQCPLVPFMFCIMHVHYQFKKLFFFQHKSLFLSETILDSPGWINGSVFWAPRIFYFCNIIYHVVM